MVEKQATVNDRIQNVIEDLSSEEKIALIIDIGRTLTLTELLRARDEINDNYTRKIEAEKTATISEMETRFQELGISLEDVIAKRNQKRPPKQPSPPKYISPDGKTWSGRGIPPKWIQEIEKNGLSREEYRIVPK
jgi:DNA-binding protein H-NS